MRNVSIIFAVIIVALIAFKLRGRIVAGKKVTLADIPAIFKKLADTKKEGSFAAFIFNPPGLPDTSESINIQFSVEGTSVGLDWILLGPANVRDRERFSQFAGSLGYTVSEREMNGVKYLRTVGTGNLPSLCEKTIRDLYSVPAELRIDLIVEGIDWP
jgi:hypothetical protein